MTPGSLKLKKGYFFCGTALLTYRNFKNDRETQLNKKVKTKKKVFTMDKILKTTGEVTTFYKTLIKV